MFVRQSNQKMNSSKMISEKFSTKAESFTEFERGPWIDWRLLIDTPMS